MTDAIPSIGHNMPPEPTPFEKARDRIDELYDEAKLWLDGKPVDSPEVADGLANMLSLLRTAHNAADEARKAENEPFDKAKAEVQARYAPLIADTKAVKGKTVLAQEIIKKALAPWLAKVEAEKRAAAEAARREAEEKQRAAQEAMRATQAADLAAREEAERLLKEANKADKAAGRAERDTARTGGGMGRAVSLRTRYVPVLADPVLAARHYWQERRADMEALLMQLASEDVRAGKRDIPGFEIREERSVA